MGTGYWVVRGQIDKQYPTQKTKGVAVVGMGLLVMLFGGGHML